FGYSHTERALKQSFSHPCRGNKYQNQTKLQITMTTHGQRHGKLLVAILYMSTQISPQTATELVFCATRFSSGQNFESSFEVKLPCSPATCRDWGCPEGPMLPRC